MEKPHHPVVEKRNDRRWIVRCGECQRGGQPMPIGIDMPLESAWVAKLLRDNHAGHPGQSSAKRSA